MMWRYAARPTGASPSKRTIEQEYSPTLTTISSTADLDWMLFVQILIVATDDNGVDAELDAGEHTQRGWQ